MPWTGREFRSALSIHRYSLASLTTDGLRSVFGLAVSFGPLAFLDVALPLVVVLMGMGVVFILFTIRLIEQICTSIELTEDGLCLRGARSRRLRWPDLTSLKLAHYGVPRRSSPGWYQLSIRTKGVVVKVDSTIEKFSDIVTMAAQAAADRSLALDPATIENLKVLESGDTKTRSN